MVAEESVAKLINKEAMIMEVLKSKKLSGLKKEEALKKHPGFIAANKKAAQATKYAAEVAEEVVRGPQQRSITDSSFGVQAAFAAAQHNVAMARRAIVVTDKKRLSITKRRRLLTDVHEAYSCNKLLERLKRLKTMQLEFMDIFEIFVV